MQIPEAFALIIEIAEKDGVSGINELPGCWERSLADGWRFALNGHNVPTFNDSGASVPPFSAIAFHGDTPLGVVDPVGGTMVGFAEDDFIAALQAEVAR